MNNYVLKSEVEKALDNANVRYEEITLDSGWSAIITEYGGRILGPFKGDEAESIFWLNSAFKNPAEFNELIKNRDWNIGGDRFWVEPELPYFIPDAKDFFNCYVVQGQLDPGNYDIKKCDNTVSLAQNVDLEVYESAITGKQLEMGRSIASVKNPYEEQAAKCGVTECFGIKQEIEMKDITLDKDVYLESWILTQINPEGELIVPFSGKEPDYLDYYEPIEEKMLRKENGKLYVDVTGVVRYKLGFNKTGITGKSGYIGTLKDGRSYLLMKNFFNDVSNIYSGGPSWAKEKYGYPLFLFNDSGALGGFAEYETCGDTISGDTGKHYAMDKLYYYFFVGKKEALYKLAEEIL